MKILSQNVRGINAIDKHSWLKKLLDTKSVDLILLQETKLSYTSFQQLIKIWYKWDAINLPSIRALGALLLCRILELLHAKKFMKLLVFKQLNVREEETQILKKQNEVLKGYVREVVGPIDLVYPDIVLVDALDKQALAPT